MIENDIKAYYDNIVPSNDLIERTIGMSKNNKKIKLPKRTIAILVAIIVLILCITGYAASQRIFNDEKGIASVEQDDSLVFDFAKADVNPKSYSKTDNNIVNALNSLGYEKVLLPSILLDNSFEIYNSIPFVKEHSNLIQMKNNKYDVELQIIADLTLEDMNGFYGTGDESTICEIVNANGIDVAINIEGDNEVGYYAYIFYATDSTMYCINYCISNVNTQDEAMNKAIEFVKTM